MTLPNRMRDWLTGHPSQQACQACLVRVWSRNRQAEWEMPSEPLTEQQQRESRHFRIGQDDPLNLNGSLTEQVWADSHQITLSLLVDAWPNDPDHFTALNRLMMQVLHEFNRAFRGHLDAERNSSEDDIPF